MKWLAIAIAVAGCSGDDDICNGFATCVELTVEPAGAQVVVDELHVSSAELHLDGSSRPPSPLPLPVRVAVVAPDDWQSGPFTLTVRGLHMSASVGVDRPGGQLPRGAHLALTAFLGPDAPDRDAGETSPPDQGAPDLAKQGGIFVANQGMEGVLTSVIAVDPANADIVYTSTNSEGVFKSSDGAKSWHASNTGIENENLTTLVAGPSSRLYAASLNTRKLYRSSDGAATWTQILDDVFVSGIAVDPVDPDKLWVAVLDAGSASSRPGGLLASTNGGASLTPVDLGIAKAGLSAVVLDSSGALWVYGQFIGDGGVATLLARSTNGGANFTRMAASGLGSGAFPIQLSVDPTSPSTLYSGVERSTDSGTTFMPFTTGLPMNFSLSSSKQSFAGDGSVFYIASTSGLLALPHAGSWQQRSTDESDAVTVAPSRAQRLYLARAGSLFVSDDSSVTFNESIHGLANPIIQTVRAAPGVVLAAGLQGVFRSVDGAASWQLVQRGNFDSFFALSLSGDGKIAWANNGKQLMRSSDGGQSFAPIAPVGLPTVGVTDTVAIAQTDSQRIYFLLPHSLYRSDDGGASVTNLSSGVPSGAIRMTTDLFDANKVYVTSGSALFRSVDAGVTWKSFDGNITEPNVAFLTPDPSSATTFYLSRNHKLFKSEDDGATWNLRQNGLPLDAIPSFVFASSSQRLYLLAGQNSQNLLYRSDDAAATWRLIGPLPLSTLAVDPADPDTFYAVVQGPGMMKSVTGGL